MNSWFVRTILFFLALLIRIRYRITYKGLDVVRKKAREDGHSLLFLSNHPAVVIDPLIVSIPLIRYFSIRPLVVEYMYFTPIFHSFLRRIRSLPIPNFSTGFNPIKLKRAEKMLQEISHGLKSGENFLIYPSGTTKLTGKEHLGGAFGVHKLVSENPEATIVLVRMNGLWGSSFSRALSGGEPVDAKKALKKGFWITLKNFLFFVPKRSVTVTFEITGSDFPYTKDKAEINRYLEEWYNKPFGQDGEPVTTVSYSCFRKELPVVEVAKMEKYDLSKVPQDIQDKVTAKISLLSKMPKNQVLPNLLLSEHLGIDSLDMAELMSYLEEEFDVSGITPQDLTSVARTFLIAAKAYTRKEVEEKKWNKKGWNRSRPHVRVSYPDADSTVELFFKLCDRKLFEICVADPLRGPASYYSLKKSVVILAKQIEKMKGDRIGILLPSTITAMVLVLACQYAGKTPVMINWTVGGKHLDTVVDVSKLEVVLSSWTFLDALENVDLTRIESLLVVIEELKVEISFKDIFKGSLRALLPSRFFSFSHLQPDTEAVILFTSGTESMPKGVPLTHKNLIENQRAALELVPLYRDDVLLSFLPPFHSFGFSMTGLLPLLSGMRTVFYPNPTDSKRLARAIRGWDVSVLCGAPTFLRNILQSSDKSFFSSIRLIISGAEKAQEELYALVGATTPRSLFYEGYGITECAPVITVNTSSNKAKGVGKPLPNVELLIVDPENLLKVKKVNEVGMILTRGPNVFSGYLNRGIESPFIEINGSTWYQTGDLGSITEDGDLIISGRLKRFVKLGGEMVGLAAIEEALGTLAVRSKKFIGKEQFVVLGSSDPVGKTQLAVFTVHDLEVTHVNQMLRKYGFSNLVKIDRIIHLDEIPVSATGKVSYRALEKLLIGAK